MLIPSLSLSSLSLSSPPLSLSLTPFFSISLSPPPSPSSLVAPVEPTFEGVARGSRLVVAGHVRKGSGVQGDQVAFDSRIPKMVMGDQQ